MGIKASLIKAFKSAGILTVLFSVLSMPAYGYKVGISLTTQNNNRMYEDGPKLVKALKAKGYETILYYSGDGDIELQKKHINRFIDSKVDLMVVTPVDAEAINSEVQKAIDNKIEVIAYDSMLATGNETAYVGFDDYKIGRMIGTLLRFSFNPGNAKKDGPYVIGFLLGDKHDAVTKETYKGLMSVLKPYFDNGSYKTFFGSYEFEDNAVSQGSTDVAYKIVYEALDKLKAKGQVKIDALVAFSDAMAFSAYKAFKKQNIKLPYIVGIDASYEGAYMLKHKYMQFTAFKNYQALIDRLVSIIGEIKDSGDRHKFTSNQLVSFKKGSKPIVSYVLDSGIVDQRNYRGKLIDSKYYDENKIDSVKE